MHQPQGFVAQSKGQLLSEGDGWHTQLYLGQIGDLLLGSIQVFFAAFLQGLAAELMGYHLSPIK